MIASGVARRENRNPSSDLRAKHEVIPQPQIVPRLCAKLPATQHSLTRRAAFALAIPSLVGGSAPFVFRNVGTYNPAPDLLVHELAHAWQAQHSGYTTDYMKTAAATVGVCLAIRALGIDASPYYHRLGKAFHDYGVEQMAEQVEHSVAAILTKVKSAAARALVPEATTVSNNIRWEARGPGVVT